MHTGSCLCGAVKFTVEGELEAPDACHCTQCRKTSGHYWVSTDVPRKSLKVDGEFNVAWFRSSEKAQRGFCSTCGASLFWEAIGRDSISVAMGAIDAPTGTGGPVLVRFEPRAQLLEGELQRSAPARLELAHDQLQVAARGVDRELAARDDLEPFLGIERKPHGIAAEQDRAQLRLVVLQREVRVAGAGAAQVADLAHHPHRP